MKTPRKRRDGARPAVSPKIELRPTDAPPEAAETPSANADLPPADGQSGPDLSPRQKRVASKAAYRARRSADPAFRDGERRRVREWRLENRDKTCAQKTKARAANYNRPFVAIDSEGQNYPGDDIWYEGVRHPRQDTDFWGAAADDGRPPVGLTAAETRGLDKRPLQATQILDWLLSLPEQFGRAVFIMFSFKYDITQILKHFDYYTAWEIFKHETYRDRNGSVNSPLTKSCGSDSVALLAWGRISDGDGTIGGCSG